MATTAFLSTVLILVGNVFVGNVQKSLKCTGQWTRHVHGLDIVCFVCVEKRTQDTSVAPQFSIEDIVRSGVMVPRTCSVLLSLST